ncbi:SGNH/GDSL hydrolase family protein [Actinomyces sp. B33]|uniref:SGNH/GDSL hydrolase family protein n=1 Tax=Actinomyces sp. B33 TaxID=2942131 RepID=UPI0023414998|nr:SGNH/GDSL hydrolase family protein [Actinomyces sp. B33]MDC4233701.1 SGNH/GDSL hydrolase family protein [Actinomyces sp. B33]
MTPSRKALATGSLLVGGAGAASMVLAARRLLSLDSQRGAYRRAWEDHALAVLDDLRAVRDADVGDRPFLMVSLGDSSVQGIGAARIEESYPARLAAAISQSLDRPVALLNLSLSGGTVESVELSQIPQMRGLGLLDADPAPDLVTLSIGGNDVMLDDLPPSSYAARLGRVLDALPAGSLVSSIPSFSVMPQERRAQEMSDLLARAVADAGHVLVDLRALTLSYSTLEYAVGYHAADLFHPNSAAYARWAQEFADAWAASRNLPAPDVACAPQWEMRSARMAQSGHDI